jgi:hypothetical protein
MPESVKILSAEEAHRLRQRLGVAGVKTWHTSTWSNAFGVAQAMSRAQAEPLLPSPHLRPAARAGRRPYREHQTGGLYHDT